MFVEAAGWERPQWYASNEGLLAGYGDRVLPRDEEWESRWWSPIINAEHLAMRDRVGIVDLTAFTILDVAGPGAVEFLRGLAVAQVDVPVGRVVYTPLLNEAGGIVADLTIMRVARDGFRVVTGAASGQTDRKRFVDHLPADGSAHVFDATSAWCTLGVWGPRARDLVASVTDDDVSNGGFPLRDVPGDRHRIGAGARLPDLLRGRPGVELYAPMETGARLWDALWEAGGDLGCVPVGAGAYLTPGRMEKSYRAHGNELDLEHSLVDAGMARRSVKDERSSERMPTCASATRGPPRCSARSRSTTAPPRPDSAGR